MLQWELKNIENFFFFLFYKIIIRCFKIYLKNKFLNHGLYSINLFWLQVPIQSVFTSLQDIFMIGSSP